MERGHERGRQPLISSSERDYIRMMNVAVSPVEGLGAHVKEQGQTLARGDL